MGFKEWLRKTGLKAGIVCLLCVIVARLLGSTATESLLSGGWLFGSIYLIDDYFERTKEMR